MNLDTLMMEAVLSSETSVLTRATWSNIPEDCILKIKTEHLQHDTLTFHGVILSAIVLASGALLPGISCGNM
jgi:hypothetical protein